MIYALVFSVLAMTMIVGIGAGMTNAPAASAAPSDRIPDDIWRARTDDYLAFATRRD